MRKKGFNVKKLGKQYYNIILKLILITLMTTILYVMFFPPVVSYFFELVGADETKAVFPYISSVIDYYGLTAFLMYFLIQIGVCRIFIHDDKLLWIGLVGVILTLSVYLLISDFIYGLIAFIYGESSGGVQIISTEDFDVAAKIWLETNLDIQFVNLLSMTIIYDVILLLLSWILIKKRK